MLLFVQFPGDSMHNSMHARRGSVRSSTARGSSRSCDESRRSWPTARATKGDEPDARRQGGSIAPPLLTRVIGAWAPACLQPVPSLTATYFGEVVRSGTTPSPSTLGAYGPALIA